MELRKHTTINTSLCPVSEFLQLPRVLPVTLSSQPLVCTSPLWMWNTCRCVGGSQENRGEGIHVSIWKRPVCPSAGTFNKTRTLAEPEFPSLLSLHLSIHMLSLSLISKLWFFSIQMMSTGSEKVCFSAVVNVCACVMFHFSPYSVCLLRWVNVCTIVSPICHTV